MNPCSRIARVQAWFEGCMAVFLALQRWKQKDLDFVACLGCIKSWYPSLLCSPLLSPRMLYRKKWTGPQGNRCLPLCGWIQIGVWKPAVFIWREIGVSCLVPWLGYLGRQMCPAVSRRFGSKLLHFYNQVYGFLDYLCLGYFKLKRFSGLIDSWSIGNTKESCHNLKR